MEKRNQNLPLPTVRRMELWWAALPTVPGHVQHGTRPVVIVSNDLSNTYSPVVSVVPCTTQRRKPTLPTHVYLRGYGLSSGSIAMCKQVMPLGRCIHLSAGKFVSCPNETPCQNDRRFFSAASGAARDTRTTFLHASRVTPPASSPSKGRRAW